MPQKNTKTETDKMRTRMSELTDRIAVLEHNLKKTQALVQDDIRRLAEQIQKTRSVNS